MRASEQAGLYGIFALGFGLYAGKQGEALAALGCGIGFAILLAATLICQAIERQGGR